MDDAEDREGTGDKALLEEAIERLQDAIERESDERKKQLQDMKFVALDQWDPKIRAARENDVNGARPCLTIDKISQYRMQIINDIRRNRPAVKVRPVDSGADVDTAEVIQGAARHIEDVSSSDIAYETAAEWAIDAGCGYFRFVTDYLDEKSFAQEIYIRPVVDGFSVYLGPHLMPDGSDIEYGFVIEDMREDRFKREHPKAKSTEAALMGEDSPFWIGKDSARVAEYFYFEYQTRELLELADGKTAFRDEYDKTYPENGPEIVGSRQSSSRRVKWCKLTGVEILEKRDWAGAYIPIVKVTGHQKVVEGKKLTWGIVRPAIDSARMYNYWASTITEKLALAPKSPFIAAEGQIEGHEEDWAQANRSNIPVLQYKAIDVNGNVVPAPRRVEPAPIEAAMVNQLHVIEHDIQTSLGMFKASVGENQGDQSGRAIRALQSQSDTATFHFPDNLALSIRHGGRILVDLIPKIYDTARIIRIIGDDGKPRHVALNPDQPEAKRQVTDMQGKVRSIYNLGVGKYDVTVTVGPSYATKRMETVDFMQDAIKGNPNLVPIVGDLMFKAIDAPMADQISERLHKMLPPQLQDGEDAGAAAEQKVVQLNQAMQAAQQQMQAMAQENQQLKSGAAETQMKIQAKQQADAEELQQRKQLAVSDREFEIWKAKLDSATQIEKADIAAKNALTLQAMEARKDAEIELSTLIGGDPGVGPDGQPVETPPMRPLDQLAGLHMQGMQQHREGMDTLAQALNHIGDALTQQLELQRQTLLAFERPRSVAIGAVKKNGSGEITGAEISTRLN